MSAEAWVGLVAILVTIVLAVCAGVIKLAVDCVRWGATLGSNVQSIARDTSRNRRSHKRLSSRVDEHGRRLDAHDQAIAELTTDDRQQAGD